MAQVRGKRREDWALTVVPAGTPAEARAVAGRVLAMVAGWVQRDAGGPGSGPEVRS